METMGPKKARVEDPLGVLQLVHLACRASTQVATVVVACLLLRKWRVTAVAEEQWVAGTVVMAIFGGRNTEIHGKAARTGTGINVGARGRGMGTCGEAASTCTATDLGAR
ncbi:hypothetical protein NDU88_000916 [Pleurodeles waltl]|uniref:Uncharacterized protein n=1 Tax=Pleurodeles waltl TaxID=8319 RepID=A0AAV7SA25_PLEWA|nr:hypothetical protein NDU88_000916 [Pleurodeles waltl]